MAAVTAFFFALPDRPRTEATNSPPAVTTASESPLNESETAGNLESTELPKVMEEPRADSDAERVPSAPSDASSEPLQSELEVDGKTAQKLAETDEGALVAATLAQKVADKLARSERRMDFDWSTRAKGVKFRIAASEKTISDVSECRNLRFKVVDGMVSDFSPDQLWCKLSSNEGWANQAPARR